MKVWHSNNLQRPIFKLALITLLSFTIINNAISGWFKTEEAIMGTRIIVDIWHHDTTIAKQCSEAVFDEMRRIDELMNPLYESSEIKEIRRRPLFPPRNWIVRI